MIAAPVFREADLVTSIVKESFYQFFLEFWREVVHEELVPNWHIEYLCDELQIVAERVFAGQPKLFDLLVNIPPGSTKSTVVSQMFPAWCWTRMGSSKFLCGSYAQQVALKDAVRMRDIIRSDLYQSCFPNIQLREDENMKGLFVNTEKGFRLSVGVGGAATGYHGHFLLIDDPLNPEESYSEAELKTTNRWMETTLPSRKVDKEVSVIILVQQRLHQSDPSGEMVVKHGGAGLKHICLPGELTPKVSPYELRERYVDGLLDPVRMSRTVLQAQEKELGAYGYASQILQDPVPLGGGMFKTDLLKLEDEVPAKDIRRWVRSWDKAGTEEGGAWSVGVLMGIDKADEYWVVDVVRGQWGSTKRERMIAQTADLDGEDVTVILEIEGGSGGKESGEHTVKNLAGHKVLCFHPTGDKESRAYPFSSQVGSGNVHVLKRDWTRDYIEELRYFPASKYKDQVDASGAAFNRLAKKKKRMGGW